MGVPVEFNQPTQLPPDEPLWPIEAHQQPEVVHTVEEFVEAMFFCPQLDRVVVLSDGIRKLGQEHAIPELLREAVAKTGTVRDCLDQLDLSAAGRFRGRIWRYAKKGEEKEIKRKGNDKSLDVALHAFRQEVNEGKLRPDVPVYVSELRWLQKQFHPIERDDKVKTALNIDIYDTNPLAKHMPLWERSEGGIFIGERGTGSGLHTDQCLWSNVGRQWTGFKLLALWPWEERKTLYDDIGKGRVMHMPLTEQDEGLLRRAKVVALIKPGDVWTFSGAQPHTALCVGDGISLSAYESFVPASFDAVATLVRSNCKEAHVKHCWMDDEDLDELYEDVVDNIQRSLQSGALNDERLYQRLKDCERAMRERGDAYCKELWQHEDVGARYRRREDSRSPSPANCGWQGGGSRSSPASKRQRIGDE